MVPVQILLTMIWYFMGDYDTVVIIDRIFCRQETAIILREGKRMQMRLHLSVLTDGNGQLSFSEVKYHALIDRGIIQGNNIARMRSRLWVS